MSSGTTIILNPTLALKSANASRIGFGFDVHRLVEGRTLILGGVEIPHDKGLDGHSDADVLLHALMDALLGAAALGDIGKHFPNTDPRFKNISSVELLKRVGGMLKKEKYAVINCDVTVVLEKPKILPHIENMRRKISDALNVSVEQISIKATTNEGLGFIGAQDGAVAHAVASVIRE
jgi:2-C-methyl-D-erythritol 2,4-cyclodiphosphate synthase